MAKSNDALDSGNNIGGDSMAPEEFVNARGISEEFEAVKKRGWSGLDFRMKAKEIVSSYDDTGYPDTLEEALDQLTQAHQEAVKEIIGEDEVPRDTNPQPDNVEPWARNDLRAEQRKRAGIEDGNDQAA